MRIGVKIFRFTFAEARFPVKGSRIMHENQIGINTEMGDGKIILHLDMDSFYASVEIRDNPSLSGRPVVVGADPMHGTGRGVVSTCSYEARAYGLHSGMPISQAYHLCPHAVFIRPRMALYAAVSSRIMQILKSMTPEIEQVSIDEAYCDLTGDQSYVRASSHAEDIKQVIREQEGLTCSVGLGPSRIYAKMASEQQKPDGCVIIPPEDLLSFLHPLPVGKIPGIGKRSVAVLASIGILTVGDIARCDIQILQDLFGSHAVRLSEIARGLDREGLRTSGKRKSISREHTFLKDSLSPDEILSSLHEMVLSVCHELERRDSYSRTIGLRIRDSGFITKTRSVTLIQPTREVRIIENAIDTLFAEMWDMTPVRLIGIRVSGLVHHDPVQRTLFDF